MSEFGPCEGCDCDIAPCEAHVYKALAYDEGERVTVFRRYPKPYLRPSAKPDPDAVWTDKYGWLMEDTVYVVREVEA